MFKTLLELTTHFPVVAGEQEKWFGQLHIGIDKKIIILSGVMECWLVC